MIYRVGEFSEAWRSEAQKIGATIIDRVEGGYLDFIKTSDERQIKVYDIADWFGAHVKTEAEALAAFDEFDALLADETRGASEPDVFLETRETPAQTGLALLKLKFRRKEICALLTPSLREIVTSQAHAPPQARKEVYRKKGTVPGVFVYDMRNHYRWIARYAHIPLGNPEWIIGDEYERYKPSWHLITARVPSDWNHAGLVFAEGKWQCEPGREFKGWLPEADVRLLKFPEERSKYRSSDLAGISQDWNLRIHESIVFRPDTGENTGDCALRDFCDALERIAKRADNSPIATPIASACRNILLHTIGALHLRGNRSEQVPAHLFFNGMLREKDIRRMSDDGKYFQITRMDIAGGTDAPHLSATIWARARAAITRCMMELPFDKIIGVWADAIVTTEPVEFGYQPMTRDEGYMRLVGKIEAARKAPLDTDDLGVLIAEAKANGV